MADSTIIKTINGLEVYDEASREMIVGVSATSTDGVSYVATVKGIKALEYGVNFIMVPNIDASDSLLTLNVNNLGAIQIKQRLSNSAATTTPDLVENWVKQDCPVRVTYTKAGVDAAWVVDAVYPDLASGVYGTLGIGQGGTGADNAVGALNNLGIKWGTTAAASTGTPNSIYIQIN